MQYYTDNLESARLRARKLTLEDALLWEEFFNDKDVLEFFPNPGLDSDLEWSKYWINKQLHRYAECSYGLQALIHKDTNEFIGQCGLLLQEVDGKKHIEVGYHILRKHREKGYASEAAKLFIDYAFNNNLATSVISIIDTENIKSEKVALKNGLIKAKQTTWKGLDVFIYKIDKATI